MNPDIKAIWIKALRSNEYFQSYEGLRNNKGFCCLGVLMDCFINSENSDARWSHDIAGFYYIVSTQEVAPSYGLLHQTDRFKEWAGDIPRWVQHSLIHLNDTKQDDFNQIADWIEEHL